jgi:pimeloyl-ACP methyl ester carboxylesterase
MRSLQTILTLATLLCTAGSLPAQQPRAIASDPAPTKQTTQNVETVITSHGSNLTGLFLLAAGTEPHGTVILLHGFPGYEQNMDLAQAMRRDGWNVLAMHYRGSWGAEGSFSFTHCVEDAATMLAYVLDAANEAKFHIDPRRIFVIGHSMGGFVATVTMAEHKEIAGGVILTEGSPLHDGPGFFGAEHDPLDYAPLSGTSPQALEQDAKQHTAFWTFAALAAKVAPRPVLVLTANDGLRASNDELTAELKRAGSTVSNIHFDTDHAFSDHRIALESEVLRWLADHRGK